MYVAHADCLGPHARRAHCFHVVTLFMSLRNAWGSLGIEHLKYSCWYRRVFVCILSEKGTWFCSYTTHYPRHTTNPRMMRLRWRGVGSFVLFVCFLFCHPDGRQPTTGGRHMAIGGVSSYLITYHASDVMQRVRSTRRLPWPSRTTRALVPCHYTVHVTA